MTSCELKPCGKHSHHNNYFQGECQWCIVEERASLRRQNAELQQHNEALKQVVPMELVELQKQNAELRECLNKWRRFEKRHAMIVLGELDGDIESAERASVKALGELRILADKALAAQPEGGAKYQQRERENDYGYVPKTIRSEGGEVNNLYHIQDADRPMWVIAPNWTEALYQWTLLVAKENDMKPEEVPPCQGIHLVCESADLIEAKEAKP